MKALVKTLLDDLACESAEIGVVFTDDVEVQQLNFEYRRKNKTTDVLSFSLTEAGSIPKMVDVLGDVVISVPTARRQAKEYGVTLKGELTRLLIHGLLHLCGYDHVGVSKARAQQMRKREAYYYELLFN